MSETGIDKVTHIERGIILGAGVVAGFLGKDLIQDDGYYPIIYTLLSVLICGLLGCLVARFIVQLIRRLILKS